MRTIMILFARFTNPPVTNTMVERMLIGGRWSASSRTFPVHNPATGERLADVADASRDDARAAIAAAAAAAPGWSLTPGPDRARILRRAEALMLERADDLARTLTLEGGKPLLEARGEIVYAASFLGWFAGEAERTYGRLIPASVPTKRLLALRQPVGVVAAITPWNFPAAMVTRKIAPAIAAGCTVILKPAEQTPLTALRLAEILDAAGLPGGVLNVVPTQDPRDVRGRAGRESARPEDYVHGFDRGRQGPHARRRGFSEAHLARARRARTIHRL